MPEFHVESFEDMGRRLEVEVGLNRHTRLATSPPHVNHRPLTPSRVELNSVSDLVSKVWYRSPFGPSELSNSKLQPNDSPEVQLGPHP
jgi:hypothetical protein